MADESSTLIDTKDKLDNDNAFREHSKLRTVFVVCGGILVHLCLGSYYIFGEFYILYIRCIFNFKNFSHLYKV